MAQQLVYLTENPNLQATGYLEIIEFYYLLRSREYIKSHEVKLNGRLAIATRTQHFRVKDVGFWKYGKLLSKY